MNNQDPLYFVSFCIEAYKMRHNISGAEAIDMFDNLGVTDYLLTHYNVLHTQSEQWIVNDIEDYINSRK